MIIGSKYVIENAIESIPESTSSRIFSLSGQELTACYHSDCLVTMETVDLSNNLLRRLSGGAQMACVKVLNLDHNCLETCDGLGGMLNLQLLCLRHNRILVV